MPMKLVVCVHTYIILNLSGEIMNIYIKQDFVDKGPGAICTIVSTQFRSLLISKKEEFFGV